MKSETLNQVDEKQIHWKEMKSRNGVSYEVGYENEADLKQALAQAPVQSKSDFGICVDWPVGDSNWKQTKPNVVQTAAITSYALYQNSGAYKYILYFTNTQNYNYFFYDETGDHYQVNTFRNGSHYVRFNSQKPNITFATGS